MPDEQPQFDFDLLLRGISTVFNSIGRALICLDADFRIVHASYGLDDLVGPGAADQLPGRRLEDVLGSELFGADGTVRQALEDGERREGWGSTMTLRDLAPRAVSLTAAPIVQGGAGVCDPRVAYVVVVRPSEAVPEGSSGTTLFSGMVARSAPMLEIFRLIRQLDQTEATVLISGPSGTGKEMVARAVHGHSPRAAGPFVAVNCGALPEGLLESELFGHAKGAFTGAIRDRVGRFELADRGTLFLDEVGELPLPLQVKLLRVLQERTFERVGESRSRRSRARVIAATNRDLRHAAQDGEFRSDLYYRLRVVPIELADLRHRREDIAPLAQHLLARAAGRHGRDVRLSPDAVRALLAYDWPGNVRELENALEYAVAVCRSQTIHAKDLPVEVIGIAPASVETTEPHPDHGPAGAPPDAASAAAERERLRLALEKHQWRRSAAAEALGISRTTLWRRMRELDLLPD